MLDNARYSVCMATYNGEKFIKAQIDSILEQITDDTEIIIIDDCSCDATIDIVEAYKDSRLVIIRNETNMGVNKSFEKAISSAKGQYVFMADQDDLWTENRFRLMLEKLKDNILVSGNTLAIDILGMPKEFELGALHVKDSDKYKKNIARIFTGRAYYYGCAMAFRRELKNIVLPFPEDMESHDLFIAMAANMLHSNCHLDEVVLMRRIHGNNASVVKRPLSQKIYSRLIFLKQYNRLRKNIKSRKNKEVTVFQ